MLNPQLNTFIQVAENGSFSKAAEKLYITPSAVIQQINNLEKELQVSLFIRTRHGTQLTRRVNICFSRPAPCFRPAVKLKKI